MKTVSILAALGLASAALVVYADPAAAPQQGMHRHGHGFAALLKAADANGDGVLTRDEALAFAAQRFDALDANHDGKLTADEVRASFQQKRAERWKKIDTDGDGRISKAEAQANAPRLAARFGELDANGDGYLTPEELRAAFRHHRHGPSGQ
jgi:Ca2+-binding EF-hand superfamily protein